MARRKTVQRNTKRGKHLYSRNKKIRNTQREQQKIPGWNKQLSFTQNINSLGINNTKVNEKIASILEQKQNEQPQTFIEAEEIDINQIKKLQQKGLSTEQVEKKKNKVKLTLDEEWAVEALNKKYKQDWSSMERDHKTNTFQWTANQCQKKIEAYIKRYGKCPKSK